MGTFLNMVKNIKYRKIKFDIINYFSTAEISINRPVKILGIETSFDDTGFAIVDGTGKILGEAINSQFLYHLNYGGLNPPIARDLHNQNIDDVYAKCLESANMKLEDVDAIATTVKPGMPFSLQVGKDFGKNLSKIANKPFIPIHHMEAHALTVRMAEKVEFPFLVLLMSGGHCLLALAESVTNFHILGTTVDDAPGEAFDKTARRLKMIKIPEYQNISGGQAIELAAKKAKNPTQFEFPLYMPHTRNCNFTFAGLKNTALRHIERLERDFNITDDKIIPDLENFCASFQWAAARHIANKLRRGILFLNLKNLIPIDRQTLVVSGGVACNDFVFKVLKIICDEFNYRIVRPPPRLCLDNGIMIAWNGIERWNIDVGVIRDRVEIDKIDITGKAPLGDDWSDKILAEDIQAQSIKLRDKYHEIF